MLNFPSCSSIFLSISLLLPQTKSKCMSWISINFTSNRITLKCLIFSCVAEFSSHLHAKSMQVGGFLWKLQAAAWTCDNNNAGRWHHSQVTLLCVQKNHLQDIFIGILLHIHLDFKTYIKLAGNNTKNPMSSS